LQQAQFEGDEESLFDGFKEASANCPEVVADFNSGKSNSTPKLLLEDFESTVKMVFT